MGLKFYVKKKDIVVIVRALIFLSIISLLTACGSASVRPNPDHAQTNKGDDTKYSSELQEAIILYSDNHFGSAAILLTVIAKRSPETILQHDPQQISALLNGIGSAAGSESQYKDLLQALFDAKWSFPYNQPNRHWLNLALLHLQDGNIERAREVVERIDGTRTLIKIRADKRFDPITQINPELYDVEKVANKAIDRMFDNFQKNPLLMRVVSRLSYLLLDAQRNDEVITITDPIMQSILLQDKEGPKYTDLPDSLHWVLNYRSNALYGTQQWRLSIEAMTAASLLPERGRPNVSHTINLANLLCNLGETSAASDVLARVGKPSSFGLMQIKLIELCIAVQEQSEQDIYTVLQYITDHKDDSYRSYIDSLLITDKMVDAERAIVEWIEDPERRGDALAYLQDYLQPLVLTEYEYKLYENINKIKGIPSVLDAVNEYGRIESYKLSL